MKRILLFISALCIIFQGASAQKQFKRTAVKSETPEKTALIGFCSQKLQEEKMIGVRFGRTDNFAAAIQVSKDLFKGGKIYALNIGIKDAGKKFTIFLSKKINDVPFYTQEVETSKEGWNLVILNTPQEAPTGEFCIGYKITASNDSPMAFECGAKNTKADLLSQDGGLTWKSMSDLSQGSMIGAFAIQAVVIDGDFTSLPQNDAMLVYATGESNKFGTYYAKSGTSYTFKLKVANYGVNILKSFEVKYKLGENIQTKTVSDLSLANGASTTVEIPVPFAEGMDKELDLEFIVEKPNNLSDDVESDNKIILPVNCYTNFFDRKIFIEQYTGQDCSYCYQGEADLKKVTKNIMDKLTWVTHHTFYKDAFTIDESREYATFFCKTESAPLCSVDRTFNEKSDVGICFNPTSSATVEMMDTYLSIPAFVKLVLNGEFNDKTKELKVTVSGEFLREYPKAKLNLFLIEDKIIAPQANAGANYEHNHSMRAVLSELYGDNIELDTNKKFTKTYTYTIPEKIASFKCKPDNMSIVAFVGDYTEGNKTECIVHNSEKSTIKSLVASNINNTSLSSLSVYSDSGIVYIDGEYSSAAVYSTNGELLKIVSNESSFSLDSGMYIIKLINGEQSLVKKVAVNK